MSDCIQRALGEALEGFIRCDFFIGSVDTPPAPSFVTILLEAPFAVLHKSRTLLFL
jgi:hypothetical protein